jgi:parallel beta-helix repeat protein
MKTRIFFSFLLTTLIVLASCEAQAQGFARRVNCARGQTITRALQSFGENPITIRVEGTCNENVSIVRDDVTLIAAPSGGTVNGTDPNKDTIITYGSRTVIDGLTVTGGGSGIVAVGGMAVRNCVVQNAGRSGIAFYQGGQGTVDKCTVQNNGDFGIYIEAASATVTNSTISSNKKAGILVNLSGGARIGVTTQPAYAGNTISNNGGSGILVAASSSASIGGNTINGNGTDLSSKFGVFGIEIARASASVVGFNSVTGNSGSGIFARSSSVQIGEPGSGLPITGAFANVITGNGAAVPETSGGIFGFLGSSLGIQSAIINSNTGGGIILSLRSTGWLFDSTVNNNTGNGIQLAYGGDLVLPGPSAEYPPLTVTGNTLFGLQCFGPKASVVGNTSGISGNTGGDVSPSCTGF